jgi:hypothetical protein
LHPGPPEFLKSQFPKVDLEGSALIMYPSILGVELFLWGAGFRIPNPNLIIQSELQILSRYPEELRGAV